MHRLESLDSELYSKIASLDHSDGRVFVGRIISEALKSADAHVIHIIVSYGMKLLDAAPFIDGASKNQVDDLDQVYFEKDELGSIAEASKFFSAARLISACEYYKRASDAAMLSEAAYEAIMAKE